MNIFDLDNLTKETYNVPKGEEQSYHCVIEVKQFDPRSGKRLSVPRLQKFGKKMYERKVRDYLLKQGYDIRVLHDPNAWEKENRARLAEIEKAKAEAKAKAEKEAFDKAVADKVKEELAKQQKEPKTKKTNK